MITEKQLDIFQVFAKSPFGSFTLKGVKDLANEASNNAMAIAFKRFKEERLLKHVPVGKSVLYSLDFSNDLVYYYLALANQRRLGAEVLRSLGLVKGEALKVTKFVTIVVFGSYAIGQETRASDLDVALFVEDERHKDKIQVMLKNAELKSLLSLDCHVFSGDDFLKMLTNDDENLGKLIAKKHRVVHNHQLFYGLVLEGMNRGFHI